MILVDTSVWVDFFRHGNGDLQQVLESGQVVIHPFVLGELACGYLEPRARILQYLGELPSAVVAKNEEVLYFIERHQLMGSGLGYLDVHLLAATQLSDGVRLWTYDRKLSKVATQVLPAH